MSYLWADKASCDPKSPYPLGNEYCPYCGNEIKIDYQSEDGPLGEYEECECPWCGKRFEVMVEYAPDFYALEPREWDEGDE